MDKTDIEKKIGQLLDRPKQQVKKWVMYGVIGGFIGGYLSAITMTSLTYKADVRAALTGLEKPIERVGFDLFEPMEEIPEIPPPFKF